ncbi:hypothetical protein L226DRAFT_482412 [Lentinus tigrinus ALCF2SS1-7]|uniref:Nucleolar protein 12 n=1 Tax=Lentinus tigrinus ALCF2SS1-6 TaxID=1328759 RepID=A0A5C2SFW2_9APHY|nr:hypothetical protein L227DRAFT_523368 [Lentinus tigrinus ALCF2SS1-6]RPD77705.1 hypothetical protein L226DRAFT_482412 [Lentinus tigrinus ALCF2SS1-7]
MSLSSFLLPGADKSKAKIIDTGLDDLFRATVSVPPPAPVHASTQAASSVPSDKKRKARHETPSGKTKRSKVEPAAAPSSSKSAAKAHKQAQDSDNETEDGDEESEERTNAQQASEESEGDSDVEGDPSKLVHESLLKGNAKSQPATKKAKYIPSEETPAQRDARTVFVGNVAIEVTKSRPSQKQFKRHILSFVPSAKIESVRFRSVAFKKPTAELPTDDDKTKPKSKTREHDRDRAASWRGEDKDEADAASSKRFLTPQEKKRIAFIKHEIHDHVDAVNAYVVFAHPPSAESLAARPANLPPPAPVMDPYEAARTCAEKCDGSVFLERTLRVDVVKKGTVPGANGEGEGAVRTEGAMAGDPKTTVFVGNLDFASKEEDLRAFFESLICEERGNPGQKAGDDDEESEDDEEHEAAEDDAKSRTWVKRVRIIRDRDTQLGKGFAYVQFLDRECVDEILALDQSKLKFAKRKLRVQRCKTLPGGPKLRASSSSAAHGKPHAGPSSSRPAPAPRLVPATKHTPKGNPELGAKLVHLPKDERKKVKATDPDRVARRLAKKRSKVLAEKGVKAKVDRERVRKRPSEKKAARAGAGGKESVKPTKRVRSGKALAKMNTKK